jgi:hypothetical protein
MHHASFKLMICTPAAAVWFSGVLVGVLQQRGSEATTNQFKLARQPNKTLFNLTNLTRHTTFACAAFLQIIQRLRLLGRKVQLQQQCPPPLDPPGPPTATTAAGNTAAAGGYPLSLNQHHHHQQQQFNAYPDVNTPGLQQQAAPGWGMGMGMGMLPQPNGTHQQQQQQQQQWQHAPAGCAYPAVPSAVLPAAAAAVPQAAAAATAVPAADPLANPMFLCPITQDVMVEPVLAADGYTYDKHAIQVRGESRVLWKPLALV